MNQWKLSGLFFCIFFLPFPSLSQSDSLELSIDVVYQMVLPNHPISRKANLMPEAAKMQVRLARGFFDPKIESNYSTKNFSGQDYYDLWDTYVKVPLWIGELKVGYEQNDGEFLNPENDTNKGQGLAYAGISIPLLQGAFFDQRRTALRESQLFEEMAVADQLKLLNKLILDIAKDYWEWYYAYHQYLLTKQGYDLARFRFQAVRERIIQGDLAPIDSVEASIAIQQREINLKEAELKLNNGRLKLSNHFWDLEGMPVELSQDVYPVIIPQKIKEESLDTWQSIAMEQHPDINKTQLKGYQLDIQRKMAAEMIKPRLDFSYTYLSGTPFSEYPYQQDDFWNNNKLSIDFSFPILLRKERGKLAQTKFKIQQNQFDLDFKQRKIENAVTAQYQKVYTYYQLAVQQQEMALNYQKMVRAEEQQFERGNSSFFYVNIRESKALEAEIKSFKMWADYAKSVAQLYWEAGRGDYIISQTTNE